MKISVFFLLIFFCLRPAYATDDKSVPLEPIDATSKILGGVQAAEGAWPWIAALLYANDSNVYSAQFCSGVLIDKSWVLTAAHCVQGMSATEIQVAVGAYDLTKFTGSRTPVKSIRIHPQFSSTSLYNDIALVELGVPSPVAPIALFSGESVDNTPPTLLGKLVTVLGWGLADTATTWYYPEILRQVSLPVVADSTCNDIFTYPVSPAQFCAGYYEGKDACEGDSGGPAVVQVDGHWVHAGIVSAGVSCQEYFGWYGKYTRTSAHLSFIRQYAPNVSYSSPSMAGEEDFPWEIFLPAITAKPRCDSENLFLCKTVEDCYKNSGYWYLNKCNSTPTNSNLLKYILVDGELNKYKPNDVIYYKGNISGNFLYSAGNGQCVAYPVNLNGNGSSYFTSSPVVDENLPSLMRETTILNTNSYKSESIVDFSQDQSGSISFFYDPENYYHKYPDGAVRIKSPLKVGSTWSFDYFTESSKDELSGVSTYSHKGNYSVISKETIALPIGKFETFKVYYSYKGDSMTPCLGCLYEESGYLWYYPKIGIIMADLTVGSFMDWPCFGYYKLKYEMTGSNLLKNNLPRE